MRPPVQLSAVTIVWLRSANMSMTCLAAETFALAAISVHPRHFHACTRHSHDPFLPPDEAELFVGCRLGRHTARRTAERFGDHGAHGGSVPGKTRRFRHDCHVQIYDAAVAAARKFPSSAQER